MRLAVIVAAAQNGVIGRNGSLPWHLPEDLRYFKRVTMGKPIIMGRKTFESIGRPLPGRSNIVISRNPMFANEGAGEGAGEGVSVVSSLSAALELARHIAVTDDAEELVVIGGAEVYAEAIPLAERVYLTEVHADIVGDTRLPAVAWSEWRELRRERHVAEAPNRFDFSFVVLERRQPTK